MEGLWGKSALLGTMIFCWDDGVIGEVESKMQIVGLVIGVIESTMFFLNFQPTYLEKKHLLEKGSLKFEEYLLWSRKKSKLAIQRFQSCKRRNKPGSNKRTGSFYENQSWLINVSR